MPIFIITVVYDTAIKSIKLHSDRFIIQEYLVVYNSDDLVDKKLWMHQKKYQAHDYVLYSLRFDMI